ncbi:acyclic terpene utilization AtuA family protein [Hydrogenophaga sp. 5NK40-0174]|uniref:acyclic terpene utilization AtuA family protein n=1 Tax=Hydrogenophaga sp. 5NK40-0174 TaxID=3127649 RepID=UPI0031094BB9
MNDAAQSESVLIGCGAGFAGDRPDAPGPVVQALIDSGRPSYLIFEMLAERTLALAQLRRRTQADGGYFQGLRQLLTPILAACHAHRIPIIGNFGAADPLGAARFIRGIAADVGCPSIRVAAVTGDDMLSQMDARQILGMPRHPHMEITPNALVSANVYMGADGIANALGLGADVVVTGRVADPALALGALKHHFRWPDDDWDRLAAGVLAGHLLECGAQVTGGYFADPGLKNVENLARVGYPIAEVTPSGELVMTKPDGTGGCVTEQTVKEQLLYEIHDPSAYLTPDVTLDLSGVRVQNIAPDRVRVTGARGLPRPETLKATLCFDGGHMGEGEISYAGHNAQARGMLAIDILRQRLAICDLPLKSHFDLIGVASVFNGEGEHMLRAHETQPAAEVRVRMAVSASDREVVNRALNELDALYTCGPAGGGGVRTSIVPLMQSTSVFALRDRFHPRVTMMEATA